MNRLRSLTPVVPLTFAALLGAGLALGGAFALGLDGQDTVTVREVTVDKGTAEPANFASDKPLTIAEIYRRSAPGVVQITATGPAQSDPFFGDPFSAPGTQNALGSGFVIDKAGYIVTNYHVVEGARSIRVTFSNNTSINARLVGTDPSTDLAVIKVETPASALTPLPLGDSDKVQVGDSVVAIGNPFGLSRTVTAGIVSAIQREITAPADQAGNQYAIDHVIQTDAPINHGNSGGPLLNARGEVIGVNSQIQTGGTSDGNVGIGFAVPVNSVKTVAAQLIKSGKVEHPALGILGQDVTPDVAKLFRLPVKSGVIVQQVQPKSGAAAAGLKGGKNDVTVAGESYTLGGDIIVEANSMPVDSLSELRDVLDGLHPGDTVTLKIYRGDQQKTVKVKLGRR